MQQAVVVVNSRRIDIMQKQVSYAKHIRKLFLFDTVNRCTEGFAVSGVFNLRLQFFQPAC